ncbi:MAG: DUF434 domain-containing protein [Methanothrix sp.]|uniref:DUF434 domain-containing protein n=1 Tax=Methanothrix sp. TaxID=90426 RepID=UPI00247EEEE6|nr:DUF434 domain-containing protein [Methanothrix sp.]
MDLRYLLNRGYPPGPAVRFVADHYRIDKDYRNILARAVLSEDVASSRRLKAISLEDLRGRGLHIDGYNVLITVESIISGEDIFLCDDGFIRDMRCIFRKYRRSEATDEAVQLMIDTISRARPSEILLLLDKQISRSGELASDIGEAFSAAGIPGTARTARDVDRALKSSSAVVATSDGIIIDRVSSALDIPALIARRMMVEPIRI